ncbi:MAG: hypothetical protein CVU90_12435 [Firmicutes bacterium HGW-Firmicutes-15]|nr:MAG: hypothetical protein CVU90_12435 [Firmicutes bacterium HGW-Firmicutes-15]
MNDKTLTKIILDIVMMILFLIMIDPKNTGMTLHEVLGLSVAALFTFHIILNWSWVKSISKNLFNPILKTKPKLFYVTNVVSFISVMTIIATGIEISQVLFVSESAGISHSFVTVHKWVSYFCLGLFGVHIIMHWRFIINAMLKLFAALKAPALGKTAIVLGTVVLGVGLGVGLFYSQIASSTTADADRVRREPPSEPRKVQPSKTRENHQNNTVSTNNGKVYEYPTSTGQTTSIATDTNNAGTNVTLTDYLGKIFCNGCDKHCSLLALQCDKGTQQLQSAKTQYQQQYASTSLK